MNLKTKKQPWAMSHTAAGPPPPSPTPPIQRYPDNAATRLPMPPPSLPVAHAPTTPPCGRCIPATSTTPRHTHRCHTRRRHTPPLPTRKHPDNAVACRRQTSSSAPTPRRKLHHQILMCPLFSRSRRNSTEKYSPIVEGVHV